MREFEPADISNDFVQNISCTELNPVRWGGRGWRVGYANQACDSRINLRRSCIRCVYGDIIGRRKMSICVIMECSQLLCVFEYLPGRHWNNHPGLSCVLHSRGARHSPGRDWWGSSRGTDKSLMAACFPARSKVKTVLGRIYKGNMNLINAPPSKTAPQSVICIMQYRGEEDCFEVPKERICESTAVSLSLSLAYSSNERKLASI